MAKLRAAVVGAGFIAAKKHIPALRKQGKWVELTAICDLDGRTAEELAQRFSIPRYYTDLTDMLSAEKPDFVNICTPPQSHSAVAMQAMKEGAHVFIEKPMATTLSDSDEIIRASEKYKVKVCVGHTDLFYPPFLKARELVAQGRIGEFMGMRIFLSTPTDYMSSREDHWAHRLPGGVIGETGPHTIYMTLAFINPIKEVNVHGLKRLPYPWSAFEDYRIDLIGEQAVSSVTSVYTTNQWSAQVDIWGTSGMLKLDLETMSLVQYRRTSLSPRSVAISGLAEPIQMLKDTVWNGVRFLSRRFKSTHDILMEKFAHSILQDRTPPVTAEEGREAVRVMGLIADQLNGKQRQ